MPKGRKTVGLTNVTCSVLLKATPREQKQSHRRERSQNEHESNTPNWYEFHDWLSMLLCWSGKGAFNSYRMNSNFHSVWIIPVFEFKALKWHDSKTQYVKCSKHLKALSTWCSFTPWTWHKASQKDMQTLVVELKTLRAADATWWNVRSQVSTFWLKP